jgi:hypothetical protein
MPRVLGTSFLGTLRVVLGARYGVLRAQNDLRHMPVRDPVPRASSSWAVLSAAWQAKCDVFGRESSVLVLALA